MSLRPRDFAVTRISRAGQTRRLWGFYGRYWEHGTSYTLSESTASTSGSRWLQVGIGWTP